MDGIAAEKGSGTDSKIVQSLFGDRVVNHGRGGVRETVSDSDGIPARYEEQLVRCQFRFAHSLYLARICSRVLEVECGQNGFNCSDVSSGGARTIVKKHRDCGRCEVIFNRYRCSRIGPGKGWRSAARHGQQNWRSDCDQECDEEYGHSARWGLVALMHRRLLVIDKALTSPMGGVGLAGTVGDFRTVSLIAAGNGRLDGATETTKSTCSVAFLGTPAQLGKFRPYVEIFVPRTPAAIACQLEHENS